MPSPEGGDVPPIDDKEAAEPAVPSVPLDYDESFWPEEPERPTIDGLPHSEYEAKLASAVEGLREVGGMQNECFGFAARFLGQALNHLDKAQHALTDVDEPRAMAHLSFADVHIRRVLEKPPQGWRSDEYAPEREEGRRATVAEGKTGFLSVLEAQGRLLAARREYVERLKAVAVSIPGLEATCGRPLEELLEPSTSGEEALPEGDRGEG